MDNLSEPVGSNEARIKQRKILVAVDEGRESLHALSWCLRNVVCPDTDVLILLYVKPPPTVYGGLVTPGGIVAAPRLSSEVMAAMEKYGNEMAHSVIQQATRKCTEFGAVKVETAIGYGDARDVICETAETMGVDLLVLGSHGYGLVKRLFLGSVSSYCSQAARCPVLIVKMPKKLSKPPVAQ